MVTTKQYQISQKKNTVYIYFTNGRSTSARVSHVSTKIRGFIYITKKKSVKFWPPEHCAEHNWKLRGLDKQSLLERGEIIKKTDIKRVNNKFTHGAP